MSEAWYLFETKDTVNIVRSERSAVPNYPTHSRWGRIGAGVVSVAVFGLLVWLYGSIVVAVAAGLGAGLTTFVGAIYPDVDHHNSTPRKKAVRAFQSLVLVAVAATAAVYWTELLGAVEPVHERILGAESAVPPEVLAAAVPALVAFVLTALVDPAIGLATRRHRGWTHSVPVNVVLVGAVTAAVWLLTAGLSGAQRLGAVAIVAAFLAGTFIHLGLDREIV